MIGAICEPGPWFGVDASVRWENDSDHLITPLNGVLKRVAQVNVAYLNLRGTCSWITDAHFLRAAALAMRHVLVSHVLPPQADKRAGGAGALPMSLHSKPRSRTTRRCSR